MLILGWGILREHLNDFEGKSKGRPNGGLPKIHMYESAADAQQAMLAANAGWRTVFTSADDLPEGSDITPHHALPHLHSTQVENKLEE